MSKQYNLFVVCLLVLLSSGCSTENDPSRPELGELVPICISQVSATGEVTSTRATTTITKGQIGVFRTNANTYPVQNNVPYSYNTSGWTPSVSDNNILVDHRNATLLAYYPYRADITSPVVSLGAQLYKEEQDLCYGKPAGTINNASPACTISDMKHAYARVKLSIQRDATNYVGNCAISNIAFSSNSQFFSTRTFDISNSTLQGNAGGPYNLKPGIAGIIAGATNKTCDVLLPPQDLAAPGLTLSLTIDNVIRSVSIAVSQFGNKLDSGKQYTISLLITNAEITISGGVTIQDFGGIQNGDVDAPI